MYEALSYPLHTSQTSSLYFTYLFTSAKGTSVIHSLQCFTVFSILYLICNSVLHPDFWSVDFSTSLYTFKSGTDLCKALSLSVVHYIFWFWRMGVVDRSMLKSRVLHWGCTVSLLPTCLNLELALSVLVSVWCYLSLQTSGQIVLNIHLNYWKSCLYLP